MKELNEIVQKANKIITYDDKNIGDDYNCVKDVNVCTPIKQRLLQKEEKILGIKRKYIGIVATTLGFLGFLPILYNIHITRKTNNFTFASITISFIVTLLWLYYSWYENSTILVSRSLIYIGVYGYILFMKLNYG